MERMEQFGDRRLQRIKMNTSNQEFGGEGLNFRAKMNFNGVSF